ncbi:MAG: hypothetical protein AAF371_02665 [Pseudomonadota bacterium]
MAVLRLNATRDGVLWAPGDDRDWTEALDAALGTLAPAGRVTILVHGYRFTWRPHRDGSAPHCPQTRLYAGNPPSGSARLWPCEANWLAGLGLSHRGPTRPDGPAGRGTVPSLTIGFCWDARRNGLATLLTTGRNDFAVVYDAAALAGRALAAVLAHIAMRRPDAMPDVLAHSLGARVALGALRAQPQLALGRLVLLGAAEYAGIALEALTTQTAAGGTANVYHVFSRANDIFDGIFGLLAPRPSLPGDRPLGLAGLGFGAGRASGALAERWIDLELDGGAAARAFAARGLACERAHETVSHWHFYTDPGAMAAWRAILERRPGWEIAELRRAGLGRTPTPRWSRLLPRLPRIDPEDTVDTTAPASRAHAPG